MEKIEKVRFVLLTTTMFINLGLLICLIFLGSRNYINIGQAVFDNTGSVTMVYKYDENVNYYFLEEGPEEAPFALIVCYSYDDERVTIMDLENAETLTFVKKNGCYVYEWFLRDIGNAEFDFTHVLMKEHDGYLILIFEKICITDKV